MEPASYLTPCLPLPDAQHGTQSRLWRDGQGKLLKDMRGGNLDKVRDEWEMQGAVYRCCKLTAKPIELAGPFIIMEDLGESDEITDMEKLFFNSQALLAGLKEVGVIHRDLRPGNIIIKANRPLALDFGWSIWRPEPGHTDATMLGVALYQMWNEQEIAKCLT